MEKYNPSYLLSKGYQCFNEKREPVKFDYFFSSLVSGKMFVLFIKEGIEISYGLYIKGHPPKTFCIYISGRLIYDQFLHGK